MLEYSAVRENDGAKPPEQNSSDPDGDGSPERSSGPLRAMLVADDTEPFEDPRTGVSLVCDPTGKEIRSCLRKAGLFREVTVLYLFACIFGIAGILQILIPGSAALLTIYNLWWLAAAAILLCFAIYESKILVKRYRQNAADRLEIYPDHIEMKRNGTELPLDGTGKLLCTKKGYTLIFPDSQSSDGRRPQYIIVPLRCLNAGVLPYVEAMLVAGTRPRR